MLRKQRKNDSGFYEVVIEQHVLETRRLWVLIGNLRMLDQTGTEESPRTEGKDLAAISTRDCEAAVRCAIAFLWINFYQGPQVK